MRRSVSGMVWRVRLCLLRPSVERVAQISCVFAVTILLCSWLFYERHVDFSSAQDRSRRHGQQVVDNLVQSLKSVDSHNGHNSNIKEDTSLEKLDERAYDAVAQESMKTHDDLMYKKKYPVELTVPPRGGEPESYRISNKDIRQDKIDTQVIDASALLQNHRVEKQSRESVDIRKKSKKRKNVTNNNRGGTSVNGTDVLGELKGGQAFVKIYSTKKDIEEEFDCIKLNVKPVTMVCLHENERDVHVSVHLRGYGLWEPYIVRMFQKLLDQDPELGVYDIGSHIGQYTLLAAVMNHKTVAVDPFLPNLQRLHKAIHLNLVQDRVIVARNAISDTRDTYELNVPSDNRGGAHLTSQDADKFCDYQGCPPHAQTIYMDDLLEVTNFRSAIMKIDVEGHEHRAFVHSEQLFNTVHIQYIFMEWIKLRGYYGSEADDSVDKQLVFELVDMLTERGFVACGVVLLDTLNVHQWYAWPDDIIWQHNSVRQL